MSYTKGLRPYIYAPRDVMDGTGGLVATFYPMSTSADATKEEDNQCPEARSNVLMFVAAWPMLEALECALPFLNYAARLSLGDMGENGKDAAETVALCRAAIALAKGEQP